MTEKEFLRKINNKNNKNGEFTYLEVIELLNNKEKNFNKFKSIFNKREKHPQEIINDNFELIIEKVNDPYTYALINQLLEDSRTKSIVEDKIEIVLNKICSCDYNFNMILDVLNKNNLLQENIDYILSKNIDMEKLVLLNSVLKGKSEENYNKLENEFKSRDIELATYMIEKRMDGIEDFFSRESIEEFSVSLAIMLREVLQSEKVRYIDIKKLSKGGYSDVYRIGDKILKVSENRQTYNIPNHRRILQPIIRTNFIVENEINNSLGCIEISELVNTLKKPEQDKEKLYKIYKELRDSGIIWTDARFENVGKLIKPNVQTLNGDNIYVFANSLGFDRNLNEEESSLPIGEWVILDTDFLYRQDDPKKEWSEISYSREFEERYLKEKVYKVRNSENKSKDNDDIILE